MLCEFLRSKEGCDVFTVEISPLLNRCESASQQPAVRGNEVLILASLMMQRVHACRFDKGNLRQTCHEMREWLALHTVRSLNVKRRNNGLGYDPTTW